MKKYIYEFPTQENNINLRKSKRQGEKKCKKKKLQRNTICKGPPLRAILISEAGDVAKEWIIGDVWGERGGLLAVRWRGTDRRRGRGREGTLVRERWRSPKRVTFPATQDLINSGVLIFQGERQVPSSNTLKGPAPLLSLIGFPA